jgi:hypothetical protein
MSTIIKLVLVVAILTAAFQGSRAILTNYQFEDDVEQSLLFAPTASDAEVTQQVLELAAEYELAIEAADITVSARASDRTVDITYVQQVAFIPGILTQPVTFRPSASARVLVQKR